MPEQLTFYYDTLKVSPFCHRTCDRTQQPEDLIVTTPQVEIALLESGASFTAHGFNVYGKPAWFSRVNPTTGQVPAISYGGPVVHPEDPSPESFKLTESNVILEFLADVYPESSLLPPKSDPVGRARVRFFADTTARALDGPTFDLAGGNSNVNGKIVEGLEKVQALLPDPDSPDGGEYAVGKDFTIADCSIVPILEFLDVVCKTDIGRFEPGTGTKLGEALAADKFDRLRRYKKALWARESVKKVADLDHLENALRTMFNRH